MDPVTESKSKHRDLESKSISQLIKAINREDKTVSGSVFKELGAISRLAEAVFRKMEKGGRLFYLGSGTSGRLGIVDASECPPTYGVPHTLVVGIIAGGDGAIRKAVEFAEDDPEQGWRDLSAQGVSKKDFVIGISASGKTPYVVGALQRAREAGIKTGSLSCNLKSPLSANSDYPVEVEVGPEFVTGSTRMKAGTAQKMVLNMISTSVMIKLGHVLDNQMVDMQLSNQKLVERGIKMVSEKTGLSPQESLQLLLKAGSVRKALKEFRGDL